MPEFWSTSALNPRYPRATDTLTQSQNTPEGRQAILQRCAAHLFNLLLAEGGEPRPLFTKMLFCPSKFILNPHGKRPRSRANLTSPTIWHDQHLTDFS